MVMNLTYYPHIHQLPWRGAIFLPSCFPLSFLYGHACALISSQLFRVSLLVPVSRRQYLAYSLSFLKFRLPLCEGRRQGCKARIDPSTDNIGVLSYLYIRVFAPCGWYVHLDDLPVIVEFLSDWNPSLAHSFIPCISHVSIHIPAAQLLQWTLDDPRYPLFLLIHYPSPIPSMPGYLLHQCWSSLTSHEIWEQRMLEHHHHHQVLNWPLRSTPKWVRCW